MYDAKILADSLSPEGIRLTTYEVRFPRFILAEFNTHRMLSRNSASSRAIPTEKLIEQVRENPFVPEFATRVKGMGVGESLPDLDLIRARLAWLLHRDHAIETAEQLVHTDKSRVNRILEPFMWHTAIVSATDWSNLFTLRTAESAQPEFRKIALMMKELYDAHEPRLLAYDHWHLPLVSLEEVQGSAPTLKEVDWAPWKCICAGRCARVSYLTHDGKRDLDADQGLHDRLVADFHMSPLENPARPFTQNEWVVIRSAQNHLLTVFRDFEPTLVKRLCRLLEYCGNYRGWHQYRYDIPNQHDASLSN